MENESYVPFKEILKTKSSSWEKQDAKALLELVKVFEDLQKTVSEFKNDQYYSMSEDDGTRLSIDKMIEDSERDLHVVFSGLGELVPKMDPENSSFETYDNIKLTVEAIKKRFPKG